jgi:hypothetical protein
MKRLDDLEAKREREAEFTGEKYTSRFSGKFKVPGSSDEIDKSELRWSNFKRRPADEMLLSEIASAGKNGQFRTPRHIIKLMAELVAPQLGQRMADPSSGYRGIYPGVLSIPACRYCTENRSVETGY